MSRQGEQSFLGKAEIVLCKTQYDQVREDLVEGSTTFTRQLIEDEYDIADKAVNDLIERGTEDRVVYRRAREIHQLYNSYMEHVELV